METREITFEDCAPDDLDQLIVDAEKSFGITFTEEDCSRMNTFESMASTIDGKLNLEHRDDCTLQQAFYKLRTAIVVATGVPQNTIRPGTTLDSLFPQRSRAKSFRRVESYLDLNLHVLTVPGWLSATTAISLILAVIVLFINAILSLLPFALTFVLLGILYPFCSRFWPVTVGDLTREMVFNHYIKSRRNSATYNRKELVSTLRDRFS